MVVRELTEASTLESGDGRKDGTVRAFDTKATRWRKSAGFSGGL